MKTPVVVSLLVVAVVAGGGVWALTGSPPSQALEAEPEAAPAPAAPSGAPRQQASTPEPEARGPSTPEEMPERPEGDRRRGGFGGFDRSQIDTDGDGEISDEERRAFRDQMRERWRSMMDSDGDGVISYEERRSAFLEGMLRSRRGAEMLARFDRNNDGEIEGDERKALEAEYDRRTQDSYAQLVDRYDSDANGVLSDAELDLADEDWRIQRDIQRVEMTARFDSDGDGELSREERGTAREFITQQREMVDFVGRYDSGADGAVDVGDFERFLTAYNEGSDTSDVNRDGALDDKDMAMFRELMIDVDGGAVDNTFDASTFGPPPRVFRGYVPPAVETGGDAGAGG